MRVVSRARAGDREVWRVSGQKHINNELVHSIGSVAMSDITSRAENDRFRADRERALASGVHRVHIRLLPLS